MTIKEFADKLNGREYGNELTIAESKLAEELGFVVVIGCSDDRMEFYGAIGDEVDCYSGGTAYLTESGIFENKCDDDDCPYAIRERDKCKTIKAIWCGCSDYAWAYETDIPHETFDVYEDGEKFCRGIVFSMDSLKQ